MTLNAATRLLLEQPIEENILFFFCKRARERLTCTLTHTYTFWPEVLRERGHAKGPPLTPLHNNVEICPSSPLPVTSNCQKPRTMVSALFVISFFFFCLRIYIKSQKQCNVTFQWLTCLVGPKMKKYLNNNLTKRLLKMIFFFCFTKNVFVYE